MRPFILLLLVICGWFALIGQFYVTYNLYATTTSEMFIRFFSYFTILTNIIVAVCATCLLFVPASGPGRFFGRYSTLTAITVYILVVGLIYNVILRFLWQPTGLQKVVDEMLHTLVPILFILYWLFFVAKQKLRWTALLPWQIYPLLYIIYIFIRGKSSQFYPYGFIDVAKIGFDKALQNAFVVAAVFIGLSLLFIFIGNAMSKAQRR